ncbi:MAG TPA: formate dehydrogenase subunit delta [Roseiarcus sp.]|jgi:formate dehydrogenase subunit delta|nr:formate dehydrogenase subunit delta [Roseiarcus sp.]
MSSEKIAKLVRMANQIGDYFRTLPETEATTGAADHLRRFWTPKMRNEIVAFAEGGGVGLNPVAARAVAELKNVPPQ